MHCRESSGCYTELTSSPQVRRGTGLTKGDYVRQNLDMGMEDINEERRRILRYWGMLELFSPQRVPAPSQRTAPQDDLQVTEWRQGDALPWEVLHPPKPVGKTRRVWQHTVYLGVYDVEDTYQHLHLAFGEDQDAYDERRAGLSACAGVLIDHKGGLVPDSAVLSSALWAFAQIQDRAPAQEPGLAHGFATAVLEFAEQIDAVEGDRRKTAASDPDCSTAVRPEASVSETEDTVASPQYDAEALQNLLEIAHECSGILGTPSLCTDRIIISSVAVSERRNDAAPTGIDFLNSFFLEDLAAVEDDLQDGSCPLALLEYQSSETAVREDSRIDVMSAHDHADAGVRIERLPKGRWPSDPEHGLALRQQFAVNQAVHDLTATRGLMGVNGPPGTGKTTMLREVLAGNVVERARRLASLPRPEDAFTPTTHRWTPGDKYPRAVRQLREELTGFEMVVASANNAAVENVSTEIPSRDALAENWRSTADYFADIASATLDSSDDAGAAGNPDSETIADLETAVPKAWGLVAARLGNKINRGAFRSAFWFDKKDPRTKQHAPRTVAGMQTRLTQWRDGTVPYKTWEDARAEFHRAERRVDELIERRLEAQTRLERLLPTLQQEADLAARAGGLWQDAEAAIHAGKTHARDTELIEAEHSEAAAAHDRHVKTKPGAFETLFTWGRATQDWRSRLGPLEERLRTADQHRRQARSHARHLEQEAEELRTRAAQTESTLARVTHEVTELRQFLAADREEFQPGYPDETWTGRTRELHAPWLDSAVNEARSELFLAALQLHEDFLANAAEDMVRGLRGAIDVVAGAGPKDLEPEKVRAAWQTFFLVVPMVSTTFASYARMFAGLGRESLGWLLIDEAGQASPQYAAGAIWRSQRVLAVGDPLQLQPVVTMPQKAQRDIAAAYQVSPVWIPPQASVQTLADRVSRYGTSLSQGEESVWVSAPLTVHRRCDDPMFSVCNEIAYNGIMVSGVHRRLDDPEHPDQFDSPNGPRIAPSEWLDEPADAPGSHLQPNQVARLERELQRLQQEGVAMSEIIAISPFRMVADKLAALSTHYPKLRAGTIHTAQGREADVVFLVLGGDPGAPGAKVWASSTVNLVNVAASRAKRRLYVIGDRASWSQHPYFDQLSAALRPGSSPLRVGADWTDHATQTSGQDRTERVEVL